MRRESDPWDDAIISDSESRLKVMERDRRRLEEYNARNACDVDTDMTNWDDPESESGGGDGGRMAKGADPNAVDLANG